MIFKNELVAYSQKIKLTFMEKLRYYKWLLFDRLD